MELFEKHAVSVVAGLQFYDLPMLKDALQQGVKLRPQRDPENPHDRHAISLWLERTEADAWDLTPLIGDDDHQRQRWMLGHVARQDAAVLAPALDKGKSLDIYVDGGEREGAWSVSIRLEGDAIESEKLRRTALEKSIREASEKAEERREVYLACRDLAKMLRDPGWEDAAEAVLREVKYWNSIEYEHYDEPTPDEASNFPLRRINMSNHDGKWPCRFPATSRSDDAILEARERDLRYAFGVDAEKKIQNLNTRLSKEKVRLDKLLTSLRLAQKRRIWSSKKEKITTAISAIEETIRAMDCLTEHKGDTYD